AVGSGAVEPSIEAGSGAALPDVDPGPGPGRLEPYGDSRVLAALHPEDLAVIQRISARGIPVVTVLISGRPMVAGAELESSQAFVAAWLPGTEGGGVAEVLFGRYDFTGRLSFSWPARDADAPNRGDVSDVSRFPYGFGLSYA
ncbi:MAG: glycoside hydrolase family 3 C-terminal domain-containing protein, partial [Myxococcota bacterium]|nr:glycoside hydrolase family 3 C-terminal domain-containing protein [Myxococcota bacterium]